MSADRETNHDMTNTDIAVLLADAADEVEIGIAPYQSVIRGGRRRRARRWAVVAATALVLTGSAGTLAIAGMPGGDRDRGAVAASPTPTTEPRNVVAPQRTMLATGYDQGKDWQITIDVWEAPRDTTEAQLQVNAMTEYEEFPTGLRQDSELVGKSMYFVHRVIGDGDPELIMEGEFTKADTKSGTDIEFGAIRLGTDSSDAHRLVVGQVAPTVQHVTCTWDDGTKTDLRRVPKGYDVNTDDEVIRPADGSPDNWFVCVAPAGTANKGAEVTK
ncbi:hypothetical protein AB0L99_44960 [Streptomyces sp. NPDC051954]|uniref:hypothetical protein n=1 Tax=unclassified Streptomyces TaxID=2593676 RepID=UPI00344680CA